MKKFLRALLIGLAGLLVLFAGLLVAAYLLFDGERIKSTLIDTVADKTGRQLQIEGMPELSIWPSIGVRLGRVSLSEKLSGENFAAVDRVQLDIKLLPLFTGELLADTLRIEGLRARVVRDAEGHLNIDDLLAGGDKSGRTGKDGKSGKMNPKDVASGQRSVPERAEDARASSPPLRFDIAGVQVSGPELVWQDDTLGQRVAVTDFALLTGRLSEGVRDSLSLSGKLAVSNAENSAAVRLVFKFNGQYLFDATRLILSQLSGELGGSAAGLSEIEASFKGEQIDLNRVTTALALTGLHSRFSAKAEAQKLNADLSIPELSWRGVEEGAGAGSAAQLLDVPALKLDLRADSSEQQLGGKLDLALRLAMPAGQLTLSRLAGELDLTNAQLLKAPVKLGLSGTGSFNVQRQTGKLTANLSLDETQAKLSAQVSAVSPLDLRLEFEADQVDVDRYLVSAPKPDPAAPSPPSSSTAADAPIDLSALFGKTVQAKFSVGRLKAFDVRTEDLRIGLSLVGGRLELVPLVAKLYGGQMNATATLNAKDNAGALRANLQSVDLAPLLKDLADFDLLAGRAHIDADLKSIVQSVEAAKSSLNGSIKLRVRDGAIKGVNLAKSFRDLKGKFSPRDDADQPAVTEAQTDFSEMTASFQVKNGIVRGDDLDAKSPFLRLSGNGLVDLPQSSVDYRVRATVVATTAGQDGTDLSELRGLTLPLRIHGPWAAPRYRLEFSSLFSDAAKAKAKAEVEAAKAKIDEAKTKVEERKDEARDAVRERAKDKLKGLLGR